MNVENLSRRRFLAGSGVGLGALLFGTSEATARPERYIVGTASPRATRAAERAADSVHRVLDFGDIGSAVAGTFPEAALDGLSNRPDVRYIERDGTMEAIGGTGDIDSADSEVPWGVDRVDAEKAHAAGATGAGAHVAIIDTGIDSDHPDLQANLGAGTAFVDARGPYAEPWDDDDGHGTHCAGTAGAVDNGSGVVGVSTEATLHAVKVLDKDGSGSWSDVAAGIQYVGEQGWEVGSLSLGGGRSSVVEDACNYAAGQGVLLVAAAGNSSEDVGTFAPATYDTVVAVSATDSSDGLASFSNYGTDIELAAPGVSITSTYPGGYATLSGTSMACPHVAGAAGLVMASGTSASDARFQLKSAAEDIGLASSEQGAGLLDAEVTAGSSDSAPSVSWANPTDGTTVSGEVSLRIAATDDEDDTGTLDVVWRIDGGEWQAASASSSGDYTATWDTTAVDEGSHTLEARTTDSAGNVAAAIVSVTVDNVNEPPSLDWVSPTGGDTVAGSAGIELSASDDRTADDALTVEWWVGDDTAQTATYDAGSGTYTDTWDTSGLTDGEYTLTAGATDGGGTTTTASVTVTVDNTVEGPTASVDDVTQLRSPNPHAEFEVSWSASGTDLSAVELSLRETAPKTESEGTATPDVSGSSASGTTTLKAKMDDGTGNTYDVTVTVTDGSGQTDTATVTETEDGV